MKEWVFEANVLAETSACRQFVIKRARRRRPLGLVLPRKVLCLCRYSIKQHNFRSIWTFVRVVLFKDINTIASITAITSEEPKTVINRARCRSSLQTLSLLKKCSVGHFDFCETCVNFLHIQAATGVQAIIEIFH